MEAGVGAVGGVSVDEIAFEHGFAAFFAHPEAVEMFVEFLPETGVGGTAKDAGGKAVPECRDAATFLFEEVIDVSVAIVFHNILIFFTNILKKQ